MLDRLRTCVPVFTLLLCLVMLTMRVSGVHAHRHVPAPPDAALHDHDHGHGSEAHSHHAPALDLHHDDGDEHGASSVAHLDVSVDGASTSLDRLFKLGAAAVALLIAFAFLLQRQRLTVPILFYGPPPKPDWRVHLRPLLRGPPRISAV